jgi:hypothetical protein
MMPHELRPEWQRRIDRMIRDAFHGPIHTSTMTSAQQPTLTAAGLLYHLAVIQRDLEEEPMAAAMRAHPLTIALIEDAVPELKQGRDPLALGGMRIEEAPELAPRRVELVDRKGRVLKRADIR